MKLNELLSVIPGSATHNSCWWDPAMNGENKHVKTTALGRWTWNAMAFANSTSCCWGVTHLKSTCHCCERQRKETLMLFGKQWYILILGHRKLLKTRTWHPVDQSVTQWSARRDTTSWDFESTWNRQNGRFCSLNEYFCDMWKKPLLIRLHLNRDCNYANF